MRKTPWMACLWPGVAQLWAHGSWPGLAVAIGAAVLLDLLLISSFGWSELIGQNLRNVLWTVFAAAWVAAVIWSVRKRASSTDATVGSGPDVFLEAMGQYLRGDYAGAERLLSELLRQDARDPEARLMLATLLRRVGRLAEATEELDRLARLDGAERWSVEIEDERQALDEARSTRADAA
ncbi:MAG: tetratricopeptide repeat protein [Thermoguttaceae bacterium]